MANSKAGAAQGLRLADVAEGIQQPFHAPLFPSDLEEMANDLKLKPDRVFSAAGSATMVSISGEVCSP